MVVDSILDHCVDISPRPKENLKAMWKGKSFEDIQLLGYFGITAVVKCHRLRKPSKNTKPPHNLGQRQNFGICKLHKYCFKPFEVPFDKVLVSSFFKARNEDSLGDLFHVFSIMPRAVTKPVIFRNSRW
ncbi:hypothetical protein AVEN_86502-1 [Araneus ventricosus]|uniref:Uncharacterized protein n=1 Tax=Araneus ventricosus TaxID=182803 RepID=A0A4Y2JPH3_ARAVE|nr:hypothetical protein AVEN_86502-1 [Araneus ventricosus]